MRMGVETYDVLELMTPEEERESIGHFEKITYGILPVGDPGLRRATHEDRTLVAQQYSSPDKVGAISILREIVASENQSNHTLLGRVVAVIALYDIISETGSWTLETVQEITNLFKGVRVDEPMDRHILAGALFARLASHVAKDSEVDTLNQMYASMVGNVTTRREQEVLCAIMGSRNALFRLINENNLRMTFPVATIHQGESNSQYESLGGGFPDTVIYLGRTVENGYYLPSWDKLREAAVYGAPNPQRGVNEPRALMVLIGVESEEATSLSSFKESDKIIKKRKMLHIQLRGLRRPDGNQPNYDALGFVLGSRLSRELRDEFNEIDSAEGDLSGLTIDNKNKMKIKVANDAIKGLLEIITKPIEGVKYTDGSSVSILSSALKESQRHDGIENWGWEEAIESINKSLTRTTFFKNKEGSIMLIGEREIGRIYRAYVWKSELNREDRLALALTAMKNFDCRVWQDIDDVSDRRLVHRVIKEGGNLPQSLEELILKFTEQRLFDIISLRCETIRDVREPKGLAQKLFKN